MYYCMYFYIAIVQAADITLCLLCYSTEGTSCSAHFPWFFHPHVLYIVMKCFYACILYPLLNQLQKAVLDNYQRGRAIPYFAIRLKWRGSSAKSQLLSQRIEFTGTKMRTFITISRPSKSGYYHQKINCTFC